MHVCRSYDILIISMPCLIIINIASTLENISCEFTWNDGKDLAALRKKRR